MRVVSWNVAGRVGAQPEQAAALAAAGADIVALQEVTARTAPLWRGGASAPRPPAGVALRRRPDVVPRRARRPAAETDQTPARGDDRRAQRTGAPRGPRDAVA